jgi:8-oxo-dGTP pyrophosphatase MutT (NUDIX family)
LSRATGAPGLSLLRERLAVRTRRAIEQSGTRSAAVLVALVGADDDLRLLCFERTQEVMEHKGEICFPGGSIEPHDADPTQAALREAHEELGVPREDVEVLGTLDDVHTTVSGYVITPIVGHLAAMPTIVPDPLEVARPVIVSVNELRRPGVHGTELREWRGSQREVHYYDVAGGRIWGATARILHNLLEVWSGEMSR